ncbi:uncharacterized mitochondrial protein AtMg00240-like [Ricinus communis]|uniref:uncharacterized mitochondrial protein AtMg00240-like n=1 Tax=Ricinus communis TaxID=3988 RepID=UPI000772BD4A|nr:uncharacterized mitochondrial protein AtMg00240-like [Ricinus communis]|eukprot:XP_015579093.1 uncharacterized protein LOC107261814 [Ricinus communis]
MESSKLMTTPLIVNEKLPKAGGERKVDVSNFRSLIGILLYLTTTRPDLMFLASLLSRFTHSPSQAHFGAGKRVLKYLKETLNFGLWYEKNAKMKLVGFMDSDWAGSVDDSKSTSSYIFHLVVVYFVGTPRSKMWWHNLQLRLSMLQR